LKPLPLADTSFIVALINASNNRHRDVLAVYKNHGKIIVIQSVLNEIAYHLEKQLGTLAVALFLKKISNSTRRV
jgi:predicted nucleic acid-binding protein